MNEPSVYTVVRAILTENLKFTADEVIARAKEKGVTKSDDDIRKVVHRTRTDLKERNAKRRRKKPAPPSPYTVARAVLAAEPDLPHDQVVARARGEGVEAGEPAIREAFRKVRSHFHKKTLPVPAAARTTTAPKPAADAEALFTSVKLANKTAHLCGGVAKAREIATAIRDCGGVDSFLNRLELVADILGSETSL